jgi:hypothetical protein
MNTLKGKCCAISPLIYAYIKSSPIFPRFKVRGSVMCFYDSLSLPPASPRLIAVLYTPHFLHEEKNQLSNEWRSFAFISFLMAHTHTLTRALALTNITHYIDNNQERAKKWLGSTCEFLFLIRAVKREHEQKLNNNNHIRKCHSAIFLRFLSP